MSVPESRWAHWRLQPWMLRRFALFLAILMSGGNLLLPRLPMLGLVVLLCLGTTSWRLPLRRKLWPALSLLGAVLLVTFLRPGPIDVASLATRYVNFAIALLVLNMYVGSPPGTLQRDLLAILWPMALQAIVTVVLAHTMGFLFMPLAYQDATYQSLLFVFNFHVTIDDAGGLTRPDGFFFEPGVFQIYLNLYLYLRLFVAYNLRQATVGLMAVLSTQSTTGMLICILLVGAAVVAQVKIGSLRRKALVLLTAVVFAPPLLYMTYENVQYKRFGVFNGSSLAREYDLLTGLNILMDHPVLGIGFDHQRYTAAAQVLGYGDTPLSSESPEERNTSNGLMQLLVSLGIPLGVAFFAGVIRQQLFPQPFLITAWFTLSMFGEALIFTPFFLMLAFSGYLRAPSKPSKIQPALTPQYGIT